MKVELQLSYEATHAVITRSLEAIASILPPEYKLTLVARHPESLNAQIVCTDDPDQEAVVDAIRNEAVIRTPKTL